MLKIIGWLLVLATFAFVALSIRQYHQLIVYNRKEVYSDHLLSGRKSFICLAMLYIFLLSNVASAAILYLYDVTGIFYWALSIFFVGAVFIYLNIRVQHAMALSLREKTLETMRTFVNAVDMKDPYTKGHSMHVYNIVSLFYEQLHEDYKHLLNKPKLLDAAMLHDIGKISIQDEILNKQGALNDDEWQAIKSHPEKGKQMLDDTCFSNISDWVLYHHERMDGKGYCGLKGDDIPLEARILAIADTYSALCTDRVYRRMLSHKQACKVLREVAGTQVDDRLLPYFFRIDEDRLTQLLP